MRASSSPRVAVWAILALAGCTKPSTALILAVSAQPSVPGELDRLHVTVTRDGAAKTDLDQVMPDAARLPGTLTLVDDTRSGGTVGITVRAEKAGDPTSAIEHRARVRMSEDKIRVVRVRLDYACRGVVCDPDSTCDKGVCVAIVDQSGDALPEYTDDGQAFHPSGCFDEAKCEAGAKAIVPTACTFPLAAGENAFVRFGDAGPFVLTRGKEITVTGGVATLAPSLCSAAKSGKLTSITVSSGCAVYDGASATCSPAPSEGGGGSGGGTAGGGQAGAGGAAGKSGAPAIGGSAGAAGTAGAGGKSGSSGAGNAGNGGASGAGNAGASGTGGASGAGNAGTGGASGAGNGGAGNGGAGNAGASGGGAAGSSGSAPALSLSMAESRSCARRSNGSVSCWGSNIDGRLFGPAAGKPPYAVTPTPLTLPAPSKSLALAISHACSVGVDGSLACWGRNFNGKAGQPVDGVYDPTLLGGAWGHVTVGSEHSCAVNTLGDVYCWGNNDLGALGSATATTHVPTKVSGVSGCTKVFSQASLTCALGCTGYDLACWGDGSPSVFGVSMGGQAPTAVALDGNRIAAVVGGQLWLAKSPSFVFSTYAPTTPFAGPVTGLSSAVETCVVVGGILRCGKPLDGDADMAPAGGLSGITAVAQSYGSYPGATRCVVTQPGDEVRCWGDDTCGAVGAGFASAGRTNAVLLASGATDVDVSGDATAVTDAGSAYTTGHIVAFGQTAITNAVMPVNTGLSGFTSVRLGGVAAAEAYVVGGTSVGLFSGGMSQSNRFVTASLPGLTVLSVVPRGTFDVAIVTDGSTTSARLMPLLDSADPAADPNYAGLLGVGSTPVTKGSLIPLPYSEITMLRNPFVIAFHACGVSTGNLECWGANDRHQISPTGIASSATPVDLGFVATSACAGWEHTCAVDTAGDVRCMGGNYYGESGQPPTSEVPLTTVPVGKATSVACGPYYTCAILKPAGNVRCWGINELGQLGLGTLTTSDVSLSQDVVGVTGATRVVAESTHACALAGGKVTCWGSNAHGQLGGGSTALEQTPQLITIP